MWRSIVILLAAMSAGRADEALFTPAKTDHWAWRKPSRPALPTVKNKTRISNPIDAFILARLEAAGLTPAKAATREQLIRRATFDLIGLPPTPAEIDAFVRDDALNAWEKVIDRLLAAPHYGERWGRHWLDVARYAESNGFEFDEARPDAWRYRDYVIRAFNANKPYDRFVQEQLAGDELFPDEPDALIATGFNLLGPDMTDSSNQPLRRQNTLDDMTDTVGLAFLGMTLGCARCHDHKFEPILQTDFFRVQAFFAPAEFRKDIIIADGDERRAYERRLQEYDQLTRPKVEALAELERPYRAVLHEKRLAKVSDEAREAHRTPVDKRTPRQKELVATTERLLTVSLKEVVDLMAAEDRERHAALQKELKALESKKPAALAVALGIRDKAGPAARTFVLRRGELSNPGEEVYAGWPVILTPEREEKPAAIKRLAHSTGRRAALAAWIASPEHPLTARVFVNRMWQHHFGRGIVATPSDFGVRGDRPTHPELLDWLATEFTSSGWDIKRMHRLMLTSATYQQTTAADAAALAKDPRNLLFSRMGRLRLEGEIIRDSLLAVSGRLNRKVGGPSVFPALPPEVRGGVKDWKESPDPAEHRRRSVYIFARRNLRFPFLETFDLPDSNLSCPKREQSTTAPQALALLNSSDVVAAAKALSERVEKDAPTTDERVRLVYRLALGRLPAEAELRLAREFLIESPLTELCRAIFNVNEFVYLD